jgi:hypothetical protein
MSAAAGISGLAEVRLDSLSNAAVGSFAIGSTGGWQDWETAPALGQVRAAAAAATRFPDQQRTMSRIESSPTTSWSSMTTR